jgi:hypothetical protein
MFVAPRYLKNRAFTTRELKTRYPGRRSTAVESILNGMTRFALLLEMHQTSMHHRGGSRPPSSRSAALLRLGAHLFDHHVAIQQGNAWSQQTQQRA